MKKSPSQPYVKTKQNSRNLKKDIVTMTKKQREDKEAKIEEALVSIPAQERLPPHLQLHVSCVISSGSAEKLKPTIPTRTRVRKSVPVTELPVASTFTETNTVTTDDEELLAITVEFEKNLR